LFLILLTFHVSFTQNVKQKLTTLDLSEAPALVQVNSLSDLSLGVSPDKSNPNGMTGGFWKTKSIWWFLTHLKKY